MTLSDKISHDPKDERELIETKEMINAAPAEVDRLTIILKDISKHHEVLEEFSYMYKEQDIDSFWLVKIWPLRIQAALTDGRNMVADKNEIFNNNLEKEKEKFAKDIIGW
jgi:hypothetical protein